jgi:hypothetical protein
MIIEPYETLKLALFPDVTKPLNGKEVEKEEIVGKSRELQIQSRSR